MMNILMKLMPILTAFADDTTPSNSFISGVIGWAAGIGGGIVAIFLIVSLVKDGIGFAQGKGDASIFKIIGKALFLIVIIGLVFLAVNYENLGNRAKNIGEGVINTVDNEATNILTPQE